MAKKKRTNQRRDLVTLWRGKIARVIGQGSDAEVMLLARLVQHRKLSSHEKYLVLEGAIFDVWGQRLTDREEERRERRARERQQRQKDDARDQWTAVEDAVAHREAHSVGGGPMPQVPIPDTAKPEH